jgi:hypothetical protein
MFCLVKFGLVVCCSATNQMAAPAILLTIWILEQQ